MQFKTDDECKAWAKQHEAYLMDCERRVKASWGVYYTRRELSRARGNARIAGYGRGKRLVAWIDLEPHAPLPTRHQRYQEGVPA